MGKRKLQGALAAPVPGGMGAASNGAPAPDSREAELMAQLRYERGLRSLLQVRGHPPPPTSLSPPSVSHSPPPVPQTHQQPALLARRTPLRAAVCPLHLLPFPHNSAPSLPRELETRPCPTSGGEMGI